MKNTTLISLFILMLAIISGCSWDSSVNDTTQTTDSKAVTEEKNGHTNVTDENTVTAEKDYHIEGYTFYYGEKSFDMSEHFLGINAIYDAIPVGDKIVLECHVGPKHLVYCIFDTISEDFIEDIVGANLVWHNEDIETAVYSLWENVYDYNGKVIKSYELSELEYIRGIEFSEDNTSITVTISDENGDRTDVIGLDS